jgi:hypothetical protein
MINAIVKAIIDMYIQLVNILPKIKEMRATNKRISRVFAPYEKDMLYALRKSYRLSNHFAELDILSLMLDASQERGNGKLSALFTIS